MPWGAFVKILKEAFLFNMIKLRFNNILPGKCPASVLNHQLQKGEEKLRDESAQHPTAANNSKQPAPANSTKEKEKQENFN